MTIRKLAAGAGQDLYSSRRVSIPVPQFVVFYNGAKTEPERQILYLRDSFPEEALQMLGENAASLDCHAVVLNINYGQNRKIMERCRKLEEYSIFIARIREYLGQGMSIREAIDRAVDECINEGIQEKILRENLKRKS